MGIRSNLLAVETSSKVLSVAIQSQSGALFESNLESAPRHSELLIQSIQQGLRSVHLDKNDLTHLVWGMGPGSFTGLRIGLSVLKGLSLGLGKKSFGASSLDLVAFGCSQSSGRLAVCVDARRDRIYSSMYEFASGAIRRLFSDSLLSIEEFLSRVNRKTIFTGDGLLRYGSTIRRKVGKGAVFMDPFFWYPRAVSLLRLWNQKSEWLQTLSLREMTPRYLRRSEAEDQRYGVLKG